MIAEQRSAALAGLERALDIVSPHTLRWTVREADEQDVAVERLRLLVPAADRDAVHALLDERHFRAVALAPWYRTPAASDRYGVDAADGTLLHVCTQRRLVLGSALGGWLPIGREPDIGAAPTIAKQAVATAQAMSRALTLCESRLRGAAGTQQPAPDEPGHDTLHAEAFTALFGPGPAKAVLDAAVLADATTLRRRLDDLAPRRSVRDRLRERARHALCRLAAFNRRGPRLPLLALRKRSGPALAIAVIGSDGSGKSTVSRWLAETLDMAFGARFQYFGTGDGPGSPVRRALNGLKRRSRFGAVAPASGSGGAVVAPVRTVDTTPTSLRLIWATVVAWERLGKMRSLVRARRAGFIVVTDRYPQDELAGIHDGPRLGHLLAAPAGCLGSAFARVERSLYAWLAGHVPDRVLLLDVPLALARRRRPDEPEAELARRVAVARSLRFGDAPRLVIDASESLATVKTRALDAVLDALSAPPASPAP